MLVLAGCAGTTRYIRDDSGRENGDDNQSAILTGLPTPDEPSRPIISLDQIDLTVNDGNGFAGMVIYQQQARLVVGGAGRLSWAIVGASVPGLVLDPDTGILHGVPVLEPRQGPRKISISATDSTGTIVMLTINLVPRGMAVGVSHAATAAPLVIKGTDASETLHGGAADDELEGGASNDVIDGGPGFDFVSYQSSPQGVTVDLMQAWLLQYNPGLINKLVVGPGAVKGGHGTGDVLRNIEGVIGSNHNDSIHGDHQDNVIFGGGGENRLFGHNEHNIIDGMDGDDHLFGRGGFDRLNGGRGNDFLVGGPGNDVMTGGPGTDRFDIADISTGRSSDVITDYEAGELLIIAASQGQVWFRRQGEDTYIFNNAAGRRDTDSGNGAYAVLRNYNGPLESSFFQSDGIETVIVTEIDVV